MSNKLVLSFPKAEVSAASLVVYGNREISEFSLEHSNLTSNSEGAHTQHYGKLSNISFATKKLWTTFTQK